MVRSFAFIMPVFTHFWLRSPASSLGDAAEETENVLFPLCPVLIACVGITLLSVTVGVREAYC